LDFRDSTAKSNLGCVAAVTEKRLHAKCNTPTEDKKISQLLHFSFRPVNEMSAKQQFAILVASSTFILLLFFIFPGD
jgi:hypothetical protein